MDILILLAAILVAILTLFIFDTRDILNRIYPHRYK